ncbi:MAG: S-layer homology domain-containing protein [Microcystis sp. LE19-131.1A]|uniref:S-layer homology domain-containing protein n=1 Tax=Microcystis sp. LE19-131.1A TaxID=3016439 RepID=UPI0022C53BF2|nr:S-layer homology domain-containing protein [Microcystis sp. LE19-131.1A]MCZ8241188.1 S-layer homology domain-containing protein [Microcystis sp. LE19-131.1A]
MVKTVSKFIRYSTIITLLGILAACSGNPDLENRLAADPNLQTNPIPENSPNNRQLPANFPAEIPRYSQSELLSVQTNPDNTGGQTRWQSNDPSNAIEAFYQQELVNNNWEIINPFSGEGVNSTLTARRDNLELTITITATSPNTEYSLDYRPIGTPIASPSPSPSPSPISSPLPNLNPTSFNDLESLPNPLKSHIQDLARLGVLTGNNNQFNPNNTITRREFARWLLQANNAIYANVAGKQIRLATPNSSPAFSDVKNNDPDYIYIQGLAEAGLIPSPLTGDSSTLLFRPNAPLTREDLIAWKVPLDIRKALPSANLDTIKNTWGFQDTNKINPQLVRALYADFQNAEQANIRRVFGFTTLFQPKRPVTRAEAAATLWYFGFQGDGVSAADALQGQDTQQSGVN